MSGFSTTQDGNNWTLWEGTTKLLALDFVPSHAFLTWLDGLDRSMVENHAITSYVDKLEQKVCDLKEDITDHQVLLDDIEDRLIQLKNIVKGELSDDTEDSVLHDVLEGLEDLVSMV